MIKKLAYLILLCTSCASISAPTGGPSDTTPPRVISSNPDSAAVNVSTNEFVIDFDEFVKTKDIQNLLIISPSLHNVKTEVKKKSLHIRFPDDSLKQNTTYTIMLNGAIVDYHEDNPLSDYSLFFSTGETIDSFVYTAVIIDAYTKAPCENCLLALYQSDNDSIPLLDVPVYLARSNTAGQVSIPHLSESTFNVLALSDLNKNLKLDKDESVSNYKNISVTDSMHKDTFYIYPYIQHTVLKPKLVSTFPGAIKISFDQKVYAKTTNLLVDGDTVPYQFNFSKDTLSFNINATLNDSFKITLHIDTAVYHLNYSPKSVSPQFEAKALSFAKDILIISGSQHLVSYNIKGIRIYQDSIEHFISNSVIENGKIKLQCKSLNHHKIIIKLDSSVIHNLNAQTNKEAELSIFPKETEGSNLSVKVELVETGNYIVQLISSDKILEQQSIKESQTITYNQLSPGKYRIRIIKDDNHNFLWDSGDFLTDKDPEHTILSEAAELRVNWDKELIIRL